MLQRFWSWTNVGTLKQQLPLRHGKVDMDGFRWTWLDVGCVTRLVPSTSHVGNFSFAAQMKLAGRPSHPREWNDHMAALAFPLLNRKNWISGTLQLQSQPGKRFPVSDITENTIENPGLCLLSVYLIISTTQTRNPYTYNILQHSWVLGN